MGHAWPPFDLLVRTPRLELRGATDDLLDRLVPIVTQGVYDPAGPPPFDDPMSFYEESPIRERRWLEAIWAGRARVEPDTWWRLYFVVMVEDNPVGMQDLTGVAFSALRTVTTFSWLGRPYQGQGLGKEMRAAVLHLAFAGLGAERAESEAFADNAASAGVSLSLGYQPNGTGWGLRKGNPALMARYLLTRQAWAQRRRSDIDVVGLEPCLSLLGLSR